jgi:uncharacterized protein (TIGR02246 family)
MVRVATPEGVIERFSAALLAGELDELVGLFEPDAVVLPAAGGGPLRGRSAIREALAGFAAMRPSWTDEIHRVVVAGDIAVVHNSWRWSATEPDGSSIEREGISSNVMRRQRDGGWAFVLHDPAGGPKPA